MEYSSESFDLVTSMLSFHEMPTKIRLKVLEEIGRVVKKEGRLLIIDYHPASYRLQSGWIYKFIIYFFEIAAGFEHYKNFRNFLRNNGIQGLIPSEKLEVEKMRIVGGLPAQPATCLNRPFRHQKDHFKAKKRPYF